MTRFEMTKDEAAALARYIELIRKRLPGDTWHKPGIEDALARARHRADSPDLAHAAIAAARRPENRTPAVIGLDGPHWREAERPPRAEQIDDGRRCSVCYESRERCESLWADDHKFHSLAAANTTRLEQRPDRVKKITDAVRAEIQPTTSPPTPRTLADRTATLPLDERLERVRRGLAGEVAAAVETTRQGANG